MCHLILDFWFVIKKINNCDCPNLQVYLVTQLVFKLTLYNSFVCSWPTHHKIEVIYRGDILETLPYLSKYSNGKVSSFFVRFHLLLFFILLLFLLFPFFLHSTSNSSTSPPPRHRIFLPPSPASSSSLLPYRVFHRHLLLVLLFKLYVVILELSSSSLSTSYTSYPICRVSSSFSSSYHLIHCSHRFSKPIPLRRLFTVYFSSSTVYSLRIPSPSPLFHCQLCYFYVSSFSAFSMVLPSGASHRRKRRRACWM